VHGALDSCPHGGVVMLIIVQEAPELAAAAPASERHKSNSKHINLAKFPSRERK